MSDDNERIHADEHIHKLTPEEDRLWQRLKKERNTRADWEDLNASIVGYKRRFIARHLAAAPKEGHRNE